MSKAKNNKPQEQPAAAPAEATQQVALGPNGNAIVTEQPKEAAAQEAAPAVEQPAAAPAEATQQVALGPNGNAIVTEQPKEAAAQEAAPAVEQPAAAPAEATQQVALGPNGNAIVTEQPKEAAAQEAAPAVEQPAAAPPSENLPEEHPKVLDVKRALRSFPTLKEGYIVPTTTGGLKDVVYFDLAVAEKSLAEGEELIIVERENKQ